MSTQRHGPVSFTVKLSGGAPVQQLTGTASLAAKDLGPITLPLTGVNDSTTDYTATSVLLPAGNGTMNRTGLFGHLEASTLV